MNDRAFAVCPACRVSITVDARGGLLPHHPGVNAGTPHGGAALCFPGLPERACERTFSHVAHDWHAPIGSFRCGGSR